MQAMLSAARRVVYLHGFASSARSTKADFFAERLLARGVAFQSPDFNEPDFAMLTMTRMLERLAREIKASGERPVTLMGSSLGGTLAILAAARMARLVDRVVLMAPAVMFAKPGHHLLPPERIAIWRHQGSMPFFHHAYNEERSLSYGFYEDTLQYDAFNAVFHQPTLVFQGLRDTAVNHRTVEQFARDHLGVTLSLLDDDHQLIASLPRMWDDIEAFIGLVP
ncbi:MAG: alpha/beta fold hydrolase [Luteitalea sp.]|nr:alpha/beta fold hydrolase [Luteitalea sp.]